MHHVARHRRRILGCVARRLFSNDVTTPTTGQGAESRWSEVTRQTLSMDGPPVDSPMWRTILSNTRKTRRHLTPEIALHLITEECAIYHQRPGDDFVFPGDPFWGFYWPGGQAVTRFILDNGADFVGRSVLDVGCGCGAAAIASKMVGANRVTANDIDEVALLATRLNAAANNVRQLSLDGGNLIGADVHDFDTLLVGDMFYDATIADRLHPWFRRLVSRGKQIFVGDPGRHGITEGILRNMLLRARYQLPPNVCIENNGFSYVSVWQFVAES